ncbi:MAG: PorT family protein [Bacteroidales bacterium]|nr:PorT family protein [Bacteroidales bacterium]
MKKILSIILILIAWINVSAQKEIVLNYQNVDNKKIHFGFTIGFNTMDFKITRSMNTFGADSAILLPEINDLVPGFHVGIVSNLRLNKHLDFRFLPGIALGQRKILFYDNNQNVVSEMKIESTFIDLPLTFKYKSTRIANTRPYVIGGVNVRNDMARNKEFNEDEEIYIKLKPFDVYYEMGAGLDFYLAYFKFSIEIKYSVGILNVVSSDPADDYPQYTNSIDKLNSRMFMISLHFE